MTGKVSNKPRAKIEGFNENCNPVAFILSRKRILISFCLFQVSAIGFRMH